MAKVYKVSFTLTLDDEASHPCKWIPEAIHANLEDGEDASGFEYEEVTAEPANKD